MQTAHTTSAFSLLRIMVNRLKLMTDYTDAHLKHLLILINVSPIDPLDELYNLQF